MSHPLKPSRLLQRLDAEIAAAPTQLIADCKRAERAGYLARCGSFDEAKTQVNALRAAYEINTSIQANVWINLAEALLQHSQYLNIHITRQKLFRAHALSVASNLAETQALSAAWLSHTDYLRMDTESLVKHASEALLLGHSSQAALSRVTLVIAQAYHNSGSLELAIPWYNSCRKFSAVEGDDMTISALITNMAGIRCQEFRFKGWHANDETDCSDTELASLSSESAFNFDSRTGTKSLNMLPAIQLAQINCAAGNYQVAIDLYESSMETAAQQGMESWRFDMMADIAWCKLCLGFSEDALKTAWLIDEELDRLGSSYHASFAHWRLYNLYKSCCIEERAKQHFDLSHRDLLDYRQYQQNAIRILNARLEITRFVH